MIVKLDGDTASYLWPPGICTAIDNTKETLCCYETTGKLGASYMPACIQCQMGIELLDGGKSKALDNVIQAFQWA